jgi:hypothetical protein
MSGFKLVNPLIKGNLTTKFTTKDANKAAADAWNAISEHIVGNIPQLGMTLQNMSDDSLHHFMVKETDSGSKKAKFTIEPVTIKMSATQQKKFIAQVNKVEEDLESKQAGGRKHRYDSKKDDDSSSSSSDESIYERAKLFRRSNYVVQPLNYWWYSPLLYKSVPNYSSFFVPTFVVPMNPYIEIEVTSAFWG